MSGYSAGGWDTGHRFWITAVFPVSVPVGGAVGQRLVFRADDAVIIFIVDVFPLLVPTFHGHRPLVGGGQHPAIVKHFFAVVPASF